RRALLQAGEQAERLQPCLAAWRLRGTADGSGTGSHIGMSEAMLKARPGILDIAPNKGGDSKLPGQQRVIRLASNEGPLGPSPGAIGAYRDLADELHRYPDGGQEELRAAIAALHRLPADRIVCGAGSDELISLLVRAYAGPGDEVLYSQYGFLMYPIA